MLRSLSSAGSIPESLGISQPALDNPTPHSLLVDREDLATLTSTKAYNQCRWASLQER